MREYTGNNRNLWKPRGIEDSISCVKALKIRTTFKCCDDKIQQDHILILVIVYQFSILVLKKNDISIIYIQYKWYYRGHLMP